MTKINKGEKHTPKGWEAEIKLDIDDIIEDMAGYSGQKIPDDELFDRLITYLIPKIKFLLSKERERTLRQVDRLIEYEMTDYTLKDEPLVGIINMNDFQSLKKGEHEK